MEDILKVIVEQRASDGFVLVDAPITIKVDGNFVQINKRHQTEDEVRELIMSTMSPAQRSSFALQHEANYAITTLNMDALERALLYSVVCRV